MEQLKGNQQTESGLLYAASQFELAASVVVKALRSSDVEVKQLQQEVAVLQSEVEQLKQLIAESKKQLKDKVTQVKDALSDDLHARVAPLEARVRPDATPMKGEVDYGAAVADLNQMVASMAGAIYPNVSKKLFRSNETETQKQIALYNAVVDACYAWMTSKQQISLKALKLGKQAQQFESALVVRLQDACIVFGEDLSRIKVAASEAGKKEFVWQPPKTL